MRSYLPIFALIGGLLVIFLAGFVVFNLRSKQSPQQQEEVSVPSVPLPFVILTPDSAGQELDLSVSSIDSAVTSLEYELVYNTAAGVLQGVPGSINVEGKSSIERQLTLGTCSSGVCRYDKGVKDITLTIRLRDSKGKLLNKFTTGVALITKEKKLSSTDSKFLLTLEKTPQGFYLVMQMGFVPGSVSREVVAGPYGVFTSGDTKQGGTVTLDGAKLNVWDGKSWQELVDGKTKELGIFVVIKE